MARPQIPSHAPPAFDRRPLLVFWETTRACLLACRHCRASAQPEPLPGELTGEESRALLSDLTRFGAHPPIVVLTGGDCLMRSDIFDLVEYATANHLHVAISPSVTPRLTDDALIRMRSLGVKTASLSLDGALPGTHDGVRGIQGHHDQTLAAVRRLIDLEYTVQVNTTVMAANLAELPEIATQMVRSGVSIWEVFFLISVGRGTGAAEVSPDECEAVCWFLTEAAQYGMVVRTVEAPFFRRVARQRAAGAPPPNDLAEHLVGELHARLGEPTERRAIPAVRTRDGQGIIFVAYNGDVYPAGFLPLPLGNVRDARLSDIYRTHPLLRDIRASAFRGRCGVCEYREVCGGSRSRAYAASGDPLGEDPACVHIPRAATLPLPAVRAAIPG